MQKKYLPYFVDSHGIIADRWYGSRTRLRLEDMEEITFQVNCCRKRHKITVANTGQIILHDHTEDQAERFVLAALCGPVPTYRCEEVRDEIIECFRNTHSIDTSELKKVPKVLWNMIRTRHAFRKGVFPLSTTRGPVVYGKTNGERSSRFAEWVNALYGEFYLQTGMARIYHRGYGCGTGTNVSINSLGNLNAHNCNIRASSAKDLPIVKWFQRSWRPDKQGHQLFYSVRGQGELGLEKATDILLPRVQVVSLPGNWQSRDLGIVGWADPNGPASQQQNIAWARVERAPIVIQDVGSHQIRYNTRVHGLKPKVPRVVLGWYAEILEML